jgi:hypothetical protein
MKTDEPFTTDVMRRFLDLDDVEALAEGYRTIAPAMQEVPVPTRTGIEALMDEVAITQPAIRAAAPERFYDASLVQRLEAVGFYRQLFGR